MALLTKQELAKRLGWGTNKLSVYISRRKLVLTEAGMIDANDPVNVLFFTQQGVDQVTLTNTADATRPAPKNSKAKVHGYLSGKSQALANIEIKKKEAELHKINQERELYDLRLAKLKGEYVPIEPIKALFAQFAKDYQHATEGCFENLLMEIMQKTGMSGKDFSSFRAKLIETVNAANKRAVEITKKSMNDIQQEYSEVRRRGERKVV